MRKASTIAIIFFLSTFVADAQADSLRTTWSFFRGTGIQQGDQIMSLSQASDIMKPGTEAFRYLSKARTQSTVAAIAGLVGGILVGFEVGKMMGGGETNGAVLAAGGGLIVMGIIFDVGSRKNVKRSVSAYNAAMR